MTQRPPFAVPSGYNTQLNPMHEMMFRGWADKNKVPFDANAQGPTDYDMRGYWQGMQQGNPKALPSSVNANDGRPHYPDFYKTPLHQTFSAESQWAPPGSPQWVNDSQLANPSGRIVHDERQQGGILDALMRAFTNAK